jgi:isoquinoline 1-oxidoreductase beta subunit
LTTRRKFLLGSAAIAGGVAIGYRLDLLDRFLDLAEVGSVPTTLTPYVLIDKSGVTIITPRAEMGQGIHTTLAALVAEELDVAFEDIRVEHGPASELYSNTVMYPPMEGTDAADRGPTQSTGAQTSIRDAFVKMRQAGAAARLLLMQAAADRLGVDLDTLTTRDGAVVDGSGHEIPYADLAEAAAGIEPPEDPPLKRRTEWRLLGKSLPRVDMVGKCSGTAEYGIDVALPGLLFATVRRNPRLGGKMLGFDASKASEMRGVKHIIPMESGVIVIATNTWSAFQAADQVEFDWGPAPYPETTEDHRERIELAFDQGHAYRARDRGNVDAALRTAPVVEGAYRVPYLAHATMEPLNATALLQDGRLDIWVGNQFPTLAVRVGARLTGLQEDAVHVHTTYMGGGFGRRFEMDDVEAAVHAAQAVPGRPVRVTYSREEDFTHDVYRPMAAARFRASVADGKPVALDLGVSAPSLFISSRLRHDQRAGQPTNDFVKADISVVMGASDQLYKIENYRVTAHSPRDLLPVGWWRSVGESQNCFFHECVMDELAYAAGVDPLMMRLSLLKHRPSLEVLESVAEMSNWGSRLPEGRARGVAYAVSSGVPTAQVVELSHSSAGIEIHKVYAAVDVGIALDRRNIEAQVQGGLNFGLSSAIFGEITVTEGVVDQTNFHAYPLLQMRHAPSIEVRIHERGKKITGVGEAATPTAAPALGNALFAATGIRVRELPFRKFFRFV